MRGSRIGELVRALALGYVRDRTALFFSLLFPLIFLLVLGGIFGNDSQTPRVDVFVAGDGPLISRLSTDTLDIERVSSVEDGLEQVREGDRPALIYERGRTLVVRYAASDQVGGATVRGIVEGVVNQANLEAAGTEPRYALEASRVEDDSLSPIEFFTPALLAYAISIGAVFGAALTLVTWREKGLLRRLRLAPLRPSEIATGRVMVSLAIALVQLAALPRRRRPALRPVTRRELVDGVPADPRRHARVPRDRAHHRRGHQDRRGRECGRQPHHPADGVPVGRVLPDRPGTGMAPGSSRRRFRSPTSSRASRTPWCAA